MKTLTIKTDSERGAPMPGHFGLPRQSRLLVAGSNNMAGWGLGGWTEEGVGRLTHGADVVKGPQAYTFPMAAVIDNHGGTGAELAREREAGTLYEAADGDVVILPGASYKIGVCKRGYVSLERIMS